jgi:hypothetical protein
MSGSATESAFASQPFLGPPPLPRQNIGLHEPPPGVWGQVHGGFGDVCLRSSRTLRARGSGTQWDHLVRPLPVVGPDPLQVGALTRGPVAVGCEYGRDMASEAFVPVGFAPPTSLVTDRFRLEPLGPQHNDADHAAWTSSIEHIRATPGYPDGNWPPPNGMSFEANLSDLRRHAADFAARRGFTFTVLDPADSDVVIGCVYMYPTTSATYDVTVQSWVRADRADLDVPLADAVAEWLAAEWPWERVDRCGR